jgi:MFS family permease
MIMTDISTPLNRASTIAPIMSAFSAGTAIGPAVGGYLVDSVGLRPTFYVVGLSFLTVASLNRLVLEETKRRPLRFPWQLEEKIARLSDESVSGDFRNAVGQWTPLLQNPGIRSVMIMNMLYWAALAGSQMTLLPLILTSQDGLAMTATQVGHAYMGMSLVQIFGNPIFAQAADRFGKAPAIVAGCTLISTSMAGLTFCDNHTQLAVALGVWATGSSILSTAPVAYVSDKVTESQRAQALALLRTLGDVGFLVGAMTSGALADWVGSLDTAMQAGAGFLLTGTLWFASRQASLEHLSRSQTKAM